MQVRLDVALLAAGKYRISAGWVTPASGRVAARVTFAGMPWQVDERASPGACAVAWNAVAVTLQQDDLIDIFSDSEQVLDYLEVEPAG
jgi:hypothetical protein